MNPFEEYRVTSPYGWRIHPVYGDRRFHTGIDLVKGHKSPIYAFTAGEVLFAGEGTHGSGFGGYGNVVAVLDERGGYHCYCHLDSAVVKKGQKVERGQMIGRQGNTGVSTGSHLHYEIRKTHAPHHGWIAHAEERAYEPTKYLIDFYEYLEEKKRKKLRNFDVTIKINGEPVAMGFYESGKTFIPLRQVATAAGKKVVWSKEATTIDGKVFAPSESHLIENTTYVHTRELANFIGAVVMWNDATKTVNLLLPK